MKFFQDQVVSLTDDDALEIAKKLKYEYVPKGQAVRMAVEPSDKLFYIMCGKVVCSFPSKEVLEARAYKNGLNL